MAAAGKWPQEISGMPHTQTSTTSGITPFGKPVVPDEYNITATSLPPIGNVGTLKCNDKCYTYYDVMPIRLMTADTQPDDLYFTLIPCANEQKRCKFRLAIICYKRNQEYKKRERRKTSYKNQTIKNPIEHCMVLPCDENQ
uniref:Uncharacterized protein n=1 Tax=Glossina palpalis gambiensis TaxID=67801 RepID=A0A1B0B8J4_9MUSC